MKTNIAIVAMALLTLASCGNKEEDKAQSLYSKIENLYQAGNYQATLDSIKVLREKYPKAIELRKKSLTLWQDANIKLAQQDIAVTDSALQVVIAQMNAATDIATRNKLRLKRDSLQVRYDTQCAVVRAVRMKQKNSPSACHISIIITNFAPKLWKIKIQNSSLRMLWQNAVACLPRNFTTMELRGEYLDHRRLPTSYSSKQSAFALWR